MKDLLPNPYILAAGVSLLSYMAVYGIKRILCTRVAGLIGKPKNHWDDIVVHTMEHTTQLFMLSVALYAGFQFTPHSIKWESYAAKTFFVICMIQLIIWASNLVDKWIQLSIHRKIRKNPAAANSITLLQLLAKLSVVTVITLFTLSNLGIKITTIIAGLGVGGIAVALALQKILGDLFSSLSIVLDKPFVVGDFIILDNYLGEVEKIGISSTRIRSLSGEQIIISNSDLLGTRIRNYKRMTERRINFTLNLTHQMSTDDLKKAVSIISSIIRIKHRVRFERCHFLKIGPTSLDIETVYWVLSDDYDLHMDIQQEILLEIYRAFELEKLKFAYPTQTLHISPTEVSFHEKLPMTQNENSLERSMS